MRGVSRQQADFIKRTQNGKFHWILMSLSHQTKIWQLSWSIKGSSYCTRLWSVRMSQFHLYIQPSHQAHNYPMCDWNHHPRGWPLHQPPRFKDRYILIEYVLKKVLYILHQAPHSWNSKITQFFLTLGFCNRASGASLFMFNQESKVVWLLVCVDDLIFTKNCPQTTNSVIYSICKKFWYWKLGELRFFLGMEVIQNSTNKVYKSNKIHQGITIKISTIWIKTSGRSSNSR